MYDVLEELFRTFQNQDYENGFFDIIFHVDGKELFAHRAVLASASSVFKKQFLSSKSDEPVNQPIPIFDYSYDEFYVFLYFIYIPNRDPYQEDEYECDPIFLPKNVYVLTELAHVYEIDCIKKRCAQHLSWEMDMDINDNVQINETIVLAHKCLSDKQIKNELGEFLGSYLSRFTIKDGFVNLDKSVIKAVVFFKEFNAQELCKEIYKWGEHQAMLDENMSKEEKNELVKFQLNDFIRMLKFENMSIQFLFEFAVEKDLLSIEEANKHALVTVTVNSGNKRIEGFFVDIYGVLEFLKSSNYMMKLSEFGQKFMRYSYSNFKIPSTPSTVQKMKGVDWFLLFEKNGKLCVKHRTLVKRNDYLITEMKLLNTAKNLNGSSLDKSFEIYVNAYVSVSRGE